MKKSIVFLSVLAMVMSFSVNAIASEFTDKDVQEEIVQEEIVQDEVQTEEELYELEPIDNPEQDDSNQETVKTGKWVSDAKGRWYLYDDGGWPADTKLTIDGKTYYFDKNGYVITGWLQMPEGWYYIDKSGNMLKGWVSLKGAWYYFDPENEEYPGLMVAECKKEIGSVTYIFDASGKMATGWAKLPEGWYYTDKNGAVLKGWMSLKGVWYYLDPENEEYPGLMLENCSKMIGNLEYHFTANGSMRTGWYQEDGAWYYYHKTSGQLVSGWLKDGGKWYYMDPENDNKMVANQWKEIANAWYFLKTDGSMATNWLSSGGNWYYHGSDGAMKTGWQVVDGSWYYFYKANDANGGKEGVMAKNVSIDGYKIGADGRALSTAQMKMALKAHGYSSNTKYLILVDRAACKVGIFQGKKGAWNMIKFWDCAPGKPSTPTVSGVFTVGIKGRYFDSGSARCHWYTQFRGNYLFHSVLYNRNGTIQDGRVGLQLSHGCVRLKIENAKWIYDNIPQGTKVVVY